MQDITSVASLKNAIQVLESEHILKRQLLKEQFYHTCEGFKPVNLFRSTLNDITSSPYFTVNSLFNIIGLVSVTK
ncbi:MAG: hypothetical protein NTW49_06090 [Bacteroidia bacterium]|nr:hypothetical protein [Bacteroidia bacterium]